MSTFPNNLLNMMDGCSNLCGICVNKLTEPVTLACGHRFCKICSVLWDNSGAVVCPECQARVRTPQTECDSQPKMQQTATRSSSNNKYVLPPLPLPQPHTDMLLLYHAFDDIETSSGLCNLGCYVKSGHSSRRFHFCDTCDTAYHRINYQAPHETLQGRNLSVPLTQMIPSKASSWMETQQKHQGNIQMHEKLLGHALYCTSAACGYRTCNLMRTFLWPANESRERRAFSIESQEDTYTMNTSPTSGAKTLYSPTGPSHSTRSKPDTAPSATCVSPEDVSVQSRALQIDRAVGLGMCCRLCIRAANLLHKHELICNSPQCLVPYCAELKKLNAKKMMLSTEW